MATGSRRAFQQQQVKKVISDLMTEFSNNGTVVLLSPIDQIWTDFEGKSYEGWYFFWLELKQKTKIVLKRKLPNNGSRRCTR